MTMGMKEADEWINDIEDKIMENNEERALYPVSFKSQLLHFSFQPG